MTVALNELAQRLHAKAMWLSSADGCGALPVNIGAFTSIDNLSRPCDATISSLSFLFGANATSSNVALAQQAGAVIVDRSNAHRVARPFIVDEPLLALARAKYWLRVVRSTVTKGVAAKRFLQPTNDSLSSPQEALQVASSEIKQAHESAVLGVGTVIGNGSYVGANATTGDDVIIGAFCTIGENVTINGPVKIGNRVHIDANCTVGSESFMYVEDCAHWLKVPGFCGVVVNDDVDIGAGSTIDKGLIEHTVIGQGVKLDSQIHLGHGVKVGKNIIIAGRTTVAGEASIGAGCKIGGACAISDGVTIADNVTLLGMSAVTRSLGAEGEYTSAWPVQPRSEWWKQLAKLKSIAKR